MTIFQLPNFLNAVLEVVRRSHLAVIFVWYSLTKVNDSTRSSMILMLAS